MNLDSLRAYCMSLPHVTEDIKWGHDLCFLIGEKMFCVTCLEPNEQTAFTFKCTPELFAELVEHEGITPAPYMARNHWVSLQRFDTLRDAEIKEYVRTSYEMVKAKLTKKAQAELSAPAKKAAGKARPKAQKTSPAKRRAH